MLSWKLITWFSSFDNNINLLLSLWGISGEQQQIFSVLLFNFIERKFIDFKYFKKTQSYLWIWYSLYIHLHFFIWKFLWSLLLNLQSFLCSWEQQQSFNSLLKLISLKEFFVFSNAFFIDSPLNNS